MAESKPLVREIVLVVVAGGIGLLGAHLGAQGTIDAAELSQEQATRSLVDTEMRTRKAEVYQAYLDATSIYYNQSASASAVLREAGVDEVQIDDPRIALWISTRNDYQGTVNDVYAFGSNIAVARLQRIAKYLPGSVGTATDEHLSSLINFQDSSGFDNAYETFQDGLCEEVNVDETRDCSD